MAPKAYKTSYVLSSDAFHLTRWSGATRTLRRHKGPTRGKHVLLIFIPPLTLSTGAACNNLWGLGSSLRCGLITLGTNLVLRDFHHVRAHLVGLTSDEVILRVLVVHGSSFITLRILSSQPCAFIGKLSLVGRPAPSCYSRLRAYCSYCFEDHPTLSKAERVRCQLVGRDDPQISMDPLEFMLAPHSMTDAKYNLWGSGISYAKRLLEGLDYKEFNITCLMLAPPTQGGPVAGESSDPPHIPRMVYAYSLDGFVREHVVPHNPNVMGYPFPFNTRALAGNLKLEVTNYSRELYGLGGVAHPGSGDDDGGGEKEDPKATPS
ncbi:hypothetical protein SO802_023519 [Lithocarpus litseifolius]|uniref:Uncharacterized protein n=1 Tax=Lithocarpus litseifolius TaxID=425828 RepID=A0AAW2C6G8_9ROSI